MLKTIYPFSFLALATLGMALYACSKSSRALFDDFMDPETERLSWMLRP